MMPVGVILAAGRGIRLGDITADMPKGLLEVGGMSLVERQVLYLRSCGIRKVFVITGFAHDVIAGRMEESRIPEAEIRCIFNDRWDSANNIYSLFMAREVAQDGFVLINSDDLFHPGILKKVVDSDYPDVISVDDYKRLGEEEMKVRLENGRLREINKTMAPSAAQGEYIGISAFGPDGARQLFEVIESFVQSGDLDGWYEEAFGILAKKREIRAVSTEGLPWTEVDTPEDLEGAKNRIWPAISEMLGEK